MKTLPALGVAALISLAFLGGVYAIGYLLGTLFKYAIELLIGAYG